MENCIKFLQDLWRTSSWLRTILVSESHVMMIESSSHEFRPCQCGVPNTNQEADSYHRNGVGKQCSVLSQHIGDGDFRWSPYFVDETVAGHYGSLGDTESGNPGSTSFSCQRVIGEGRRSDGRRNVKVFHFQAWAG